MGKRTSLAPRYFPCLSWFRRWLHEGVIGLWKPALYVSDENHIAYGFKSAHSLHCEMLCHYPLSTPPPFLSDFFFLKLRAISVSQTPPLQMLRSYLRLVFCERVIHQRKCVWQPPSLTLSSNFKPETNRKTMCTFLHMMDSSSILPWQMLVRTLLVLRELLSFWH